jgi:hypothetical protein
MEMRYLVGMKQVDVKDQVHYVEEVDNPELKQIRCGLGRTTGTPNTVNLTVDIHQAIQRYVTTDAVPQQ